MPYVTLALLCAPCFQASALLSATVGDLHLVITPDLFNWFNWTVSDHSLSNPVPVVKTTASSMRLKQAPVSGDAVPRLFGKCCIYGCNRLSCFHVQVSRIKYLPFVITTSRRLMTFSTKN